MKLNSMYKTEVLYAKQKNYVHCSRQLQRTIDREHSLLIYSCDSRKQSLTVKEIVVSGHAWPFTFREHSEQMVNWCDLVHKSKATSLTLGQFFGHLLWVDKAAFLATVCGYKVMAIYAITNIATRYLWIIFESTEFLM